MKTILLILFTLTSFLGAETRHLIVSGDVAKPIPARLVKKATHTLELTREQYDKATSPKWFKVVDGKPVLRTQAEVEAEDLENQKTEAKRQVIQLSEQLKVTFIVQNEGEKHQFNEHSQRLFLAQLLLKDSDIRVKVMGKKSIKIDKAKAGRIFAEISAYQNSVEDALESDLDDIAKGVLTLKNLNAIKAAQEALKN